MMWLCICIVLFVVCGKLASCYLVSSTMRHCEMCVHVLWVYAFVLHDADHQL